jgi:hypothetical protein
MQDRIEGKWVHKQNPRNVLLEYVRHRPDEEYEYETRVVLDLEHSFFFEHPLDHIPAMMLVEAGRQMGIAVSHLFLGVPLGRMFATRSFDIRFDDFAELHAPVTIVAKMTDRRYRKDELLHLRLDAIVSQNGAALGRLGGTWSMLRPEVWQRYRRRERSRLGITS